MSSSFWSSYSEAGVAWHREQEMARGGGTDEGKEKSRWRTSCIANEMSFEEADEPLAITIITAEGVFFFSSFFFSLFFLFPLPPFQFCNTITRS